MPPDRLFKFNNQRFFLTYAHLVPNCILAGLDPDFVPNIRGSLIEFVEDLRLHLLSFPTFHWAEAVSELHEDGVPHVHAVVVFRKR